METFRIGNYAIYLMIFSIIIASSTLVYGRIYNVSHSDLLQCKEYRIESEYAYRNFFLLENIQNNRNDDELLRLKFYVAAQNNAHILLSPVDNAKKDDRVYEIVIGAGLNTFSAIRSHIGGKQLTVKSQNGILNAIDATPIIVVQKQTGEVEVTIPTFISPFMYYKDPHPLSIKYISFSSYGTTPARWFYDCKGEKAAHLEMEKRNLTDLQRLQNDIFTYKAYDTPAGLTKVEMGIAVHWISYDNSKSIFKTRLEMKLKWFSPKLQWNPDDYGNLTYVASLDANYWTPPILTMNGAGSSIINFNPEYMGTVYNNGTVVIDVKQSTIETWCSEPNSTNFPWDQLTCSVDFGIHGNQQISLLSDFGIRANQMSELSEWRPTIINFTTKNVKSFGNDDETYKGASLVITMKRNVTFYHKVFFAPLVVAAILMLLSFVMNGFKRGLLNLIGMMILLFGFVVLSHYMPMNYVPKLGHLYEIFLGIACFSYYLSIWNRWMLEYPPENKPCSAILLVVNNSILRYILGMQFADTDEYLKIMQQPWKQIALMLDRLIFNGFLLFFVIMLGFYL